MLGFRPTQANSDRTVNTVFGRFTDDASSLMPAGTWWTKQKYGGIEETRNSNTTLLVEAMASCTAITYVNGNLVGDPLDVQMFQSTGWTLDESSDDLLRKSEGGHDQLVIAYVHPKTVNQEPESMKAL